MKKFENVILASDIDGTYLWHGNLTAPQNNEKIKYFIENGGKFLFSSGRNHKDIYRIIPDIDNLVSAPCVLCNGCFCFDIGTKKIINPTYLDPTEAVALCKRVAELCRGRIGWRVTWDGGFLISDDDSIMESELKRTKLFEYTTVKPLSEFDGKGYFKAVFYSSPEVLSEVFSVIKTEFPDFTYSRSSEKLTEVMPHGTSKATQLKYLKDSLKKTHPDAKLFCVGDFDNDEEMLRFADVGMCPDNATETIKDICKVQLCHCMDGAVADAIDKIEKMI